MDHIFHNIFLQIHWTYSCKDKEIDTVIKHMKIQFTPFSAIFKAASRIYFYQFQFINQIPRPNHLSKIWNLWYWPTLHHSVTSTSRLIIDQIFSRLNQFGRRDLSIPYSVYRTMPGSCLDHVGAMFSLALDKKFWIFRTGSTWSKGHVQTKFSLQDHARVMFGPCLCHV